MSQRQFNPTSTAFSVERVRAEMLENIRIPQELVQEAIDKVKTKLNAKITKHFTHQGQVIEQVDVEDHATQLSAVDKILSMAGLYARERDAKPPTPTVAVEVDAVTGVIRMVIGDAIAHGSINGAAPSVAELPPPKDEPANALHRRGSLASNPMEEEAPPEVIKVRKGGLPIEVHNALFGKDA